MKIANYSRVSVFVLMATFLLTLPAISLGQSRALFDCIDYAVELEFSPIQGGSLCRQIRPDNQSAVYDCARYIKEVYSHESAAILCRNTSFQQLSATYDCMRGFAEAIGAEAAADLCQGTSYRNYSERINCFNWMSEVYETSAAVRLCGGEQL